MLQILKIIRVEGSGANWNVKMWWDIKWKVLGERPVPGLRYRKGISQGAPCGDRPATRRLVQYSECNNAVWYFNGADCREMCAVSWRENVSSVCCEGECCGSVWTTEIWKSIKTCRRRIENSKSTIIAVCPGKLKLNQLFSKRLMYFNWNFRIIWFTFILPHSIRHTLDIDRMTKEVTRKLTCVFFISSEQ